MPYSQLTFHILPHHSNFLLIFVRYKQIQKMTDYVNVTYDAHIPYQRLVTPHKSIELADYILQIGSSYTILTYPPICQSKIEIIQQTSQSKDCYLKKKYELLVATSDGLIQNAILANGAKRISARELEIAVKNVNKHALSYLKK